MAGPAVWAAYEGWRDAPTVLTGAGCVAQLGQQLAGLGCTRALLVVNRTLRAAPDVVPALHAAAGGRVAAVYCDLQPHLTLPGILAVLGAARSARCDGLVSLGSGAAIDAARATALALDEAVDDEPSLAAYLAALPASSAEQSSTVAPAPHAAIPTTLVGAAHSAGVGTVMGDGKRIFSHPALLPPLAFLDPELTRHTPRELWAATGIKALDHAVGRLCTPPRHPLTEAVARQAVAMLARDLEPSSATPPDPRARAAVQEASWLAMFGRHVAPSRGMSLSHALGRQIGTALDVSHALAACIALPAALAFNREAIPDEIAALAPLLGVGPIQGNVADVGVAAIAAIEALIARLGLPRRLRELSDQREKLPLIARWTLADASLRYNPRPIADEAPLLALLEAAW